MKSALRPRHVALLVLVSGLVLTVSAWYFAGGLVNAEGQTRTAERARLAAELLQRRMQRYIDVLYGVEAFAYRDPAPSHAEFRRFVAALDITHRFPGLQGVGLLRRVKDTERAAYVKRMREDRSLSPQGFSAFDIRPGGQRDEYWVLDSFEPFEGHEALFGTDVRTRGDEAAAAARALQSGGPAATGRYRLSESPDAPYGVIIYLAAARTPATASPTTRAAPPSAPAFVDAVLSVDGMLGDTFSEPLLAGTQVRILDRGEMGSAQVAGSQESVFYRTSKAQEAPTFLSWFDWHYRHSHELPVAGRLWSVDFQSAPETHPWITRFPLLVLASGLAVTMATYLAVAGIPGARRRASAQAASTADELRRQLSFTQQLIEAIPNPVFFKDATGRYLGCNRAFEESMGVARADLIGKTAHDVTAQDDADFSVRADTALFERTGSQVYETELDYASDGERHDVLISKATFYAPSGEVAGLVGVLLDITERKRLEADTLDSHERLRAVIRAAPLAIVARDLDVVIRMWNPAAERMFGWSEAEALETKILVVPDRLRAETRALRLRAEAGETISIEETRRVRRDGTEIDVSVSMAPIYGGEGVVTGTMIAIVDISLRKAAERALRESEEQLRLAMEAAQMGMWYWEVASDRFLHSEGLSVLFGGKSTDREGDYRPFRERLHPDDQDLVEATLRHAVKKGTDFQVDYRVIWPDGSVHWLANRAQVHRDASGRAERIVGMAMEITDRKLAEQRIAHMAHHDALTGLPNRVLLRDRIQQAIAQAHRGGTQLAVLFLDLDRFKNINDSLGHQLGDRLLQSVASRILVCVREGDTVARVGGDEFVIVIPGLGSSPNAASVASKILEVLASPFHLGGNDLHVGASLGISLYPADGSDAETLMRNADTAMYHAKDSGRGNYQFFTQHMNVTAQQRLTVETALRRALEAEEFELYYQPIYDLRDRSITGFEALLRWNAPGGELVQPARFITAAEESGLIVPIGDWVLRQALMHAKTWQSAGRPLMVSVNVSAYQLARPPFVEQLRTMLEEISIDPELVELEVTEGVIIEGAGDARDAIDHVAALGVGIAIDDFGTGYSGLAYLKRLPIDTVKIDQSFVRDLTVDPDDAAIVTAIVAMAKSLGVDVVAEGVETEEQLAELRRLGCHRAQGFLFAHPMSAGDVWTLLKAEGPSPP